MTSDIATLYFTVEYRALKYKNDVFLSFSSSVYIFLELLPSNNCQSKNHSFKTVYLMVFLSPWSVQYYCLLIRARYWNSLYSNLLGCEVLGKFLKFWELCFLTCNVGIMASASWEFNKLMQRKLFV